MSSVNNIQTKKQKIDARNLFKISKIKKNKIPLISTRKLNCPRISIIKNCVSKRDKKQTSKKKEKIIFNFFDKILLILIKIFTKI